MSRSLTRIGWIVALFAFVVLTASTADAAKRKKGKRKTTTSIAAEPIGTLAPTGLHDDDLPPLTATPRAKKEVAAPPTNTIVPLKPGEHPSAIQLCFDLPADQPFAVKQPLPGYVPADDGWYVVDTELTLNGRFIPERVTRQGTSCVRAWVPAMHVKSVAANFDRSFTNLRAVTATVDLKLKKDKWHDAGRVAVERAPWASVSTQLPGQLAVFRVASNGRTKLSSPDKLARGRYAVEYEPPPPPSGPCLAKVSANATGTVTAERNPERFAQLLADYERDVVPDLLRERTQTCSGYERLEFRIDVRDGRLIDPWHPRVEKVRVPSPVVSYGLRANGNDKPYPLGAEFDLGDGDALELLVLEARPADTLPALVNVAP